MTEYGSTHALLDPMNEEKSCCEISSLSAKLCLELLTPTIRGYYYKEHIWLVLLLQ